MMFVPLSPSAWAAAPEGVTTTVVQARPDMLGNAFVSGWQSASGTWNLGPARLEGYGEVGWPAGVDSPVVPEIYVLTADGGSGRVDWTLGRQRMELPTWGRLLDGGRLAWSPFAALRIEAWAGQARQVGLLTVEDGLASGAPVARLAATFTSAEGAAGAWLAIAGVWGEAGPIPALHPDLRLRWSGADAPGKPDISALVAVGIAGEAPVLERGRVEAIFRPAAGVRALVYGEHREALATLGEAGAAPLGPAILATFAPEGAEEIGVGLGRSDARRAEIWGSAAVQTWDSGPDRQLGARAELAWRPTCPPESWCFAPAWHGATGPGGVYQSFGTSAALPVPQPLFLTVNAAVVPYRKPHAPWDTALVLGATAEVRRSFWSLSVGGEIAHDAIAPLDPRAWLALRLETP
ncbi:MAG: hypothetical protein Q8P18_32030 [Pseudomonadota bacterium]|nr:hypothetical protein [Pseudomonadota bacterium]